MSPAGVQGLAKNLCVAGDRFVHPSITNGLERSSQLRLLGVTIALPLFAAIPALQLGFVHTQIPIILGGLCVVFAIVFAMVATMIATGAKQSLRIVTLVSLSAIVAMTLILGGGLSSPFAIILFVPIFESWWIGRDKKSIMTGLALSTLILIALPIAGAFVPSLSTIHIGSWAVLMPFSWALCAFVRIVAMVPANESEAKNITNSRSVDELFDGVVLRFNATGDNLSASQYAQEMLEISPSLLKGSGFFNRIHLNDRIAFLTAIADLRDGEPRKSLELRIRKPVTDQTYDKPLFDSFSLDLVRDNENLFMGILQRNSELLQLRAEVEHCRNVLEQESQTKNRFLATVSHELRTPLNAIIGFADVLDHEMFGELVDERQREYVVLISKAGEHLLSVVNSILDVSKIEAGTYDIRHEPFSFTEALSMPCSFAEQQIGEKKICIKRSIGDDLPEINADRRAVQQILINLLSNAVKFTPDEGVITVGARHNQTHLTFWVNDTGIGINEDDIKFLGQPFKQVDNEYTRCYEGTGLGLSLVKGLVSLLGGTFKIDSTKGKGTCVTINLPMNAQGAQPGEVIKLEINGKKSNDLFSKSA